MFLRATKRKVEHLFLYKWTNQKFVSDFRASLFIEEWKKQFIDKSCWNSSFNLRIYDIVLSRRVQTLNRKPAISWNFKKTRSRIRENINLCANQWNIHISEHGELKLCRVHYCFIYRRIKVNFRENNNKNIQG